MPMSTMTLQAGLSWTGLHEEDRRFHRILMQSLLICFLTGAITPYIPIPQFDAGVTEELPARRVRLLEAQRVPASALAPAPAPAVVAPPQAPPLTDQLPVAPVVTPREKAARTGVLAMSDVLADLRGSAPKTGTTSRQENAAGEDYARTPQPSMLTANVTRGSQGIDGGVAHQSVMGATGLPGREYSSQGTRSDGDRAAKGRTSSPPHGVVRSEEEIQEVLDRNKGAMYTLYNHELRKDATLQGKLVMSITITPAGKVTRCVILSSELGADSLEQQLVALIKGIDFGNKPNVPAVTTKLPIEFFPR